MDGNATERRDGQGAGKVHGVGGVVGLERSVPFFARVSLCQPLEPAQHTSFHQGMAQPGYKQHQRFGESA
jgi:hypothetical protein